MHVLISSSLNIWSWLCVNLHNFDFTQLLYCHYCFSNSICLALLNYLVMSPQSREFDAFHLAYLQYSVLQTLSKRRMGKSVGTPVSFPFLKDYNLRSLVFSDLISALLYILPKILFVSIEKINSDSVVIMLFFEEAPSNPLFGLWF